MLISSSEFNQLKVGLLVLATVFVISTIGLCFLNHTHWNGIDEESDSRILDKVINRLYFVSTTLSTVGYGDVTPSSKTAKVISIILQIYVSLNVASMLGN